MLGYKYKVLVKADIEDDKGNILYQVNGGNTYINERIKSQGWDNTVFKDDITQKMDIDRRSLIPNITDRAMRAIFKVENEKQMVEYITSVAREEKESSKTNIKIQLLLEKFVDFLKSENSVLEFDTRFLSLNGLTTINKNINDTAWLISKKELLWDEITEGEVLACNLCIACYNENIDKVLSSIHELLLDKKINAKLILLINKEQSEFDVVLVDLNRRHEKENDHTGEVYEWYQKGWHTLMSDDGHWVDQIYCENCKKPAQNNQLYSIAGGVKVCADCNKKTHF